MFTPNRKFKREYNRLYRKDPAAANVYLLLCELADERGMIEFKTNFPTDAEIKRLLLARFNDPLAYQLPGGPKR